MYSLFEYNKLFSSFKNGQYFAPRRHFQHLNKIITIFILFFFN